MTFSDGNPFHDPVPESVTLPQNPLTGVVVQIVFPEILSIAKADRVADFQERIRSEYPLSQQDHELSLQVLANGVDPKQRPNWRFFDVERQWRLSLTTTFLAIETRVYSSRKDLVGRVGTVAKALEDTIEPEIMTRLGVRYIDRVHGEPLARIEQLVRPEVLGLYVPDIREQLVRTQSEMTGNADTGSITARCGFMPEKQTHDPDLMPALAVPSWYLDIDVYQRFSQPAKFDAGDIQERSMALATRSYGFFRWVVNDEFLKAYGGRP